ncbi:MAG TPA: MOSC domain-containing protein [Solirubrobacteraceae bacterium]|nr:MOSC domain-containing protein [Solirubrobacteraceae bacterium]
MTEITDPSPGTPADRSLAACLASLLGLQAAAIPAPGGAPPLVMVRQWLAERGLGLVAVADPGAFSWAGPWIAEVADDDDDDGDGERYVVMFGVPSGVIFDPLNPAEAAPVRIRAGYVLASLEPPHPDVPPAPVTAGRVESIFVAPEAQAPMQRRDEVRAVAGRGLEGDRYAGGQGTFSVAGGRGNEVTLIAGEVLDTLQLPGGRPLSGAEARRNIVTRDVDLNALVGRRFRIGELELIGRRRCEPCAHLQRLTRPGVLRGLVHRGGLRADLLSSGTLRVGDRISPAGDHDEP